MRLILESFLLSFGILWRVLIVFPFIAAASFVLMLGLGFVTLGLAIPVILLISATFAALVAMRAGLQARGVWNTPSLGRLVKASAGFGVFQVLIYILFGGAAGLAIYALTLYGVEDLGTAFETFDPADMWSFVAQTPLTLAIGLIATAAIAAIFTAIQVPMAAAAFSASERGPNHHFFWGMGASFLPILIVLAATFAINIGFGVQLRVQVFVAYAVTYAGLVLFQQPVQSFDYALLATGLLNVAISLWLYSWSSAAAALGYLRHREWLQAEEARSLVHDRIAPDDLRSLRKSRQA